MARAKARSFVVIVMSYLWLASFQALAISFERYHDQDEINAYMDDLALRYPAVRVVHLGYSDRGRAIKYLIISKGDPSTLPAIYLNGTHHGNEKSSTEAVLGLIDFLTQKQNDPEISALLENYALYLQPLINPDGHASSTRTDSFGRDLNRDYAAPEKAESESFRSQTTRLVKDLADKTRFRAALAFHSGMEGVLWPWGYTNQRSHDYDLFFTLAKITADAMRMPKYLQSYSDYPTRGEFIDYVYNTHATLALTVEVSDQVTPSPRMLARVVQRAIAGSMAFLLSIRDLDNGKLDLQKAPDNTHLARATNLEMNSFRRAE